MHFIRRILLGLFLLGMTFSLLGVGGYFIYDARSQNEQSGGGGYGPASRERVFSVAVTKATGQSHTPWVVAFGEVLSTQRLMMRTAQGGRIIQTHPNFVEGGRVAMGDLIAKIDPTDAQSALLQAEADAADAALEKVQADASLQLAVQEVAAAQEQLRLRETAMERQKNLIERGIGATAALETAELSLSSARQALLTKEQAFQTAQARIKQAQTRFNRAQLSLDIATRNLNDTEIFAPFSGVLSGINMRNDGRVGVNETIAELIAPETLEVAVRLSTSQYTRLLDRAGALTPLDVDIVLEAGSEDFVAKGTVSRDSPQVGQDQTGRLIFVDVQGGARALKVGDFVTVRIYEPELPNAVRVPAAALGRDQTVLVIGAEDRLEELPITVLRRIENDVLIDAEGFEGREYVDMRTAALGAGIKVSALRRDENGNLIAPPKPERKARGGPGAKGRPKGAGDAGGGRGGAGGKRGGPKPNSKPSETQPANAPAASSGEK
ncbi:MAG: HlyD family efflux transporter periplasmic adaptor subunit [Paracoccaceae bacterium]|jgi:RND family efflux transporter MFP subunit